MNQEEILAVLNGVSFEDDFVQVLSLRPEGTEVEFPLTKGPVNFSVMSDSGLSVRWGVTVERKGDVYIYNRDVKNAEKVSLHASGRQHIAITSKTAIRVGTSSRFGPRWTEPEFDQEALPLGDERVDVHALQARRAQPPEPECVQQVRRLGERVGAVPARDERALAVPRPQGLEVEVQLAHALRSRPHGRGRIVARKLGAAGAAGQRERA